VNAARSFCGKCGDEITGRSAKDPQTDVPVHECCLKTRFVYDNHGRRILDGVRVRLVVGLPPRVRCGTVTLLDVEAGTFIVDDDDKRRHWGATNIDVQVLPTSQACRFDGHARCPGETTLGTERCLCTCHKKAVEK
jgi:hypothetical protein